MSSKQLKSKQKLSITKVKSPAKLIVLEKNKHEPAVQIIQSTESIKEPQVKSPRNPIIKLQKQLVQLPDGMVYEGHILNDIPQGQGTLKTGQGKLIYAGQWENGSRTGFGKYVYLDGSVYQGMWKNNVKEGDGIYTNQKGENYNGKWSQNKREGYGRLKFSNDTIIEGQWKNDDISKGRITYPNKDVYEGQIRNYCRDGKGIYYYFNGDKFEGTWDNNNKEGYGVYTYANGNLFRGTINKNLKHGANCHIINKSEQYQMKDAKFQRDRFISGNRLKKT